MVCVKPRVVVGGVKVPVAAPTVAVVLARFSRTTSNISPIARGNAKVRPTVRIKVTAVKATKALSGHKSSDARRTEERPLSALVEAVAVLLFSGNDPAVLVAVTAAVVMVSRCLCEVLCLGHEKER